MTASDGVTLALPAPSTWDFGGHPYGLEPLTLPYHAESAHGVDGWNLPAAEDLESSRNNLLALDARDGAAGLPAHEQVERIFWFRWIIGHQTTFVLWQMLARAMAAVSDSDGTMAHDADAAAESLAGSQALVRGCSAMLLYTGSCPRALYHRVIRPSMALQHPGFSGSWARDFWPVRYLVGARAIDRRTDTPLGQECALNRVIHDGVAQKLVPDAPSLLQTAVSQRLAWRRSTLAVLYDNYFLTLRAQIPHQAVMLQLMRRLHAIGRDLTANGLYPPFASSIDEKPLTLRTPAVIECEQTMLQTLFALATQAADSQRGQVNDEL